MKDIELSQLPKIFKLSLATFFSKEMEQELPKDSESSIDLFDKFILRLLRKSYKRKSHKIKVLWDLLQCKDLANQVPKSMIQGAYEKHMKTLTAVGVTPDKILINYRCFCREFCEEVKKNFEKTTKLPPKTAYFNSKRSEGGALEVFKRANKLCSQSHENRSDGFPRIDPVVFHMFGKPGTGKSFFSTLVSKELSRRFGYQKPNQYCRSIATDHWDGYNGQLISVIDDIFTKREDEDDCGQIIQICSNVDYVLPMADLREKGMKFKSDFLFLSSNFPEMAGNIKISNQPALRRRLYPAFKLLERNGDFHRLQRFNFDIETNQITPSIILEMPLQQLTNYICDFLIEEHRLRRNENFIRIPVYKTPAYEPNISVIYPIKPPERFPKVMAHAIPEALKVRMITKAEENVWILKPVQIAMWKALQAFPCFKLTSTPVIPLDLLSSFDQKTYLLSGDYESATDNLNMDITRTMIEELIKVLPTEFKDWLTWEGGVHEIHYPSETKLEPVLQTRGQLMGSLLSFPILCVANAATIGIVKKQELKNLQALINGDDILFTEEERKIKSWKRISSSMGLKPSIGKNYQSKDWGSINSQLITRKGKNFLTTRSGCFGAISKVTNFLSNFRLALEIEPENKPYFVHIAKDLLKKTPESIDISTDFGGLGPSNMREPTLQDKEIYFFKLLRKTIKKVSEIDDVSVWRVPYHLMKKYGNVLDSKRIHEIPDIEDGDQIDQPIFKWTEFRKFQKFYKTNPILRERIRKSNLQNEIPIRDRKSVV